MITEIKPITEESINLAVKILNGGGIIGMPTETVYGLGAVATDSDAVKKIFQVKGRPSDNPLIAHVHKDFDIKTLVEIEHEYVYALIKAFMPGPLTLVLKSKGVVCFEAVCGGDTLAVRMPSHSGCQELLKRLNKPVVAPSANLSKHTSPVTAKHVYDDLNGKIELILDGGRCSGGIESTVLDVTEQVPRILRAGLVTKEMVEKIVGECLIAEHKATDKVKSPGVKYRHYRPKCETALFSYGDVNGVLNAYMQAENQNKKPFIMCASEFKEKFNEKNLLLLGDSPEEIACNLYNRLLEGEKVADIIIAMEMPNENGVYLGIMNRLRKSCG